MPHYNLEVFILKKRLPKIIVLDVETLKHDLIENKRSLDIVGNKIIFGQLRKILFGIPLKNLVDLIFFAEFIVSTLTRRRVPDGRI